MSTREQRLGRGLRLRQSSSRWLGVCSCDTSVFFQRDPFADEDRHQLWTSIDIYSLGGFFLLPVASSSFPSLLHKECHLEMVGAELQLLSPSTWHSSHHVISNSAHRFPHRTASIRDFEVVWLLSALSLHLSVSTVFRVRLLIFLPKRQGLLSASCSASDVCFLGSQEDPAIFQRQSFRKR